MIANPFSNLLGAYHHIEYSLNVMKWQRDLFAPQTPYLYITEVSVVIMFKNRI